MILGNKYTSYEEALEKTSLTSLSERRQERCLKYALKATRHPENQKMFPPNIVQSTQITRERESFHVNFAYTEAYRRSAIPYLQRLLNSHKEKAHRTDGTV